MNERIIPETVTANQHAASDPAVSAWVSANAGAGKTHVLTQRVIRLLLNGTDPSKILCLTFTKAAAANMANRIFNELRKWISLDDASLDVAIGKTGAKAGGVRQRERARRLFASALETPGGLKVQTIHAFCTRLLQQFPFEANVPARFRVLEEVEQRQLLEQLRRAVLFEASGNPDSDAGRALAALIPVVSDFGFQEGLDQAIQERERLLTWLDDAGGLTAAAAQLSEALGIEPGDTLEVVEAAIVDGPHLPSSEWMSVAGVCGSGTSNDQAQARRLQEAIAVTGRTRVENYLKIFYTGGGDLRGSILTAGLGKKFPDLHQRFGQEKLRVACLCEKRKAVMIRDRTVALAALAIDVIERYRNEKNRRGLLDYDDLIARTLELLEKVDAAWVHYKLDLGIDHLLIDEAQDTSPDQWEIIKNFVAEFTAGAGARSDIRRTIFAVGDDKQSIFSFQGAKPQAFDDTRRHFKAAHDDAKLDFLALPFSYSFRSVPLVLQAVDTVFAQPAAHKGLTVDPTATVHQAVRAASPGLVELWPLVKPDPKDEVDPWDQPFDTTSETSPRVVLARQIADAVKTWMARGDLVGDGEDRHPVRAGDILILVRQRGPLFEAIIRALKSADVAVAGADRLKLVEHIAIMDLLALADALLHPQDDLALAAILKSPLFGISEDDLLSMARGRKRTLRVAVRSVNPGLGRKLDDLDEASRNLSPFTFYARLLGSGARKAFVSRLGPEANDALDEFLNLALAYESRQTPSLQGFVHWIRTASTEVKRDMEITRDEVRVMTVHGAKGLEAPVVVLADTTTVPAGPVQYQPKLFSLPVPDAIPGTPDRIAWMPTKRDDVAVVAAARAVQVQDNENESRRLLYVAMTRAADCLIVCGSVGVQKMPPECWYELIQQGLETTGLLTEEPGDFKDSKVWRYRKFEQQTGNVPVSAGGALMAAMPEWLTHDAAPDEARGTFLRPSDFESRPGAAATAVSRIERSRALARGTHIHRLMQSLPDVPSAQRVEAARRYLARQKELDDAARKEITEHTLRLLGDLQFDRLFLPGSRAEVSIVGRVGGRLVSGQVDRLVVGPDEVLIADYKTNRPAPRSLDDAKAHHPGYIRQIALYRAVLTRLYPGRRVRAALLWTDTPDLMEIPAADLDAALP